MAGPGRSNQSLHRFGGWGRVRGSGPAASRRVFRGGAAGTGLPWCMGSDPNGDTPVALVRVRFTGGPLAGAVVELPVELADPHPGQLLLTASGGVYDRHRNWRRVEHARVLRPPFSARGIRTLDPRPDTVQFLIPAGHWP